MSPTKRHLKGPHFDIGDHTYGIPKVWNYGDETRLTIGKFCSIADGVQIWLGGNHRTDWITTFPFSMFWAEAASISGHPATHGDVSIGNDVWIGSEAMIMSGVTIADGAVIGARAQVARNIPPYAIAAGNPARVKGFRFSPEIIEQLLMVKWWHWPVDRIKRALPYLLSADAEAFLNFAMD